MREPVPAADFPEFREVCLPEEPVERVGEGHVAVHDLRFAELDQRVAVVENDGLDGFLVERHG